MSLSVAEVAATFGVDGEAVKSWVYHFSEYLSPAANPGKGTPRRFTPEDVQVLAYVFMYWEEKPDIECIKIGLNCDDHQEEPYQKIRTELTPLFQDPPEELDETWDWGTLIGGMGNGLITTIELAESYRFAADTLVDTLISHPERYALVFPVMYNYRHATELYLKGTVRGSHGHGLKSLLEALRLYLKTRHGATIPRWFESTILEFDDYDPGSTTFRYSEPGVLSRRIDTDGELWIDFRHLKQRMAQLAEAFRRILTAGSSSFDGSSSMYS